MQTKDAGLPPSGPHSHSPLHQLSPGKRFRDRLARQPQPHRPSPFFPHRPPSSSPAIPTSSSPSIKPPTFPRPSSTRSPTNPRRSDATPPLDDRRHFLTDTKNDLATRRLPRVEFTADLYSLDLSDHRDGVDDEPLTMKHLPKHVFQRRHTEAVLSTSSSSGAGAGDKSSSKKKSHRRKKQTKK